MKRGVASGWAAGVILAGLAVLGIAEEPTPSPSPTPKETPAAVIPSRPADVQPLSVGEMLPDATVTDSEGQEVRLRSLLGTDKLVLVFYRGGWCPYCNSQLAQLRTIDRQVAGRGARLIGISMDRPELLARYSMDKAIPFPLYSDSKADTIRAFGLAYRVPDEEVARLKTFGVDLEATSGANHHLLPAPAVYVMGTDGKVLFRYYSADSRTRLEPQELLKALDK